MTSSYKIPKHGQMSVLDLYFLTLFQMTNFRLFQTEKSFADDNFRIYENGKKVSKQVETAVGKGVIARYKQFLVFPTVFSKALYCRHKKPGLVWERVNLSSERMRVETAVGKGVIARYEQFLVFPQCF